MRFSEIIGQDVAITQLRRAYAHHRLSHAYIFDGPQGAGKKQTALALASLLLCEQPTDADSCGVCAACRQIAAGTHPDCHVLAPDGRTIKIKQIRDLRAALAQTSEYGGTKVVIIEDADAMGIEAANAFLKTMEEPRGDSCFILLTRQAERLPETIRSRAQRVRFRPLSDAALTQLLAGSSDAETIALAVQLAEGALDRARAIITDAELRERVTGRRDALYALLPNLASSHDGKLLRFAQGFSSDRDGVREEILLMRRYYRDLLHGRVRDGLSPAVATQVLHATTAALARLETNTEPSHILGALLIQAARCHRA
ncbi:MAG: DNA polymerase III subunit delta' [Peptococcaceae bacterium]|nr:DNA polymerase III subunit delta' [Peptococcaceae bacterium]